MMAAEVVSARGIPVAMFEKNRVPGRKLLIAGSSGLNITHDCPLEALPGFYGDQAEPLRACLEAFPPERWLEFVESLGIETFKGTSRRYFVRGLKASKLLRAWMRRLVARGVEFRYGKVFGDFEPGPRVGFEDGTGEDFAAVILALGGASYEKAPPRWPDTFRAKGLRVIPFQAANVGYAVEWPAAFLAEAEGLPLKNVALKTARGTRVGDLMVTRYGLEGTPVYTLGVPGPATLDLKPDLSQGQIVSRLLASKENLSPLRRVQKFLNLSPAAQALVFHLAPENARANLHALAAHVKAFPIALGEPQPIEEAISSSGGLDFSELTPGLMLRQFPGVFAAGEMLNWDAPTGGFLIQGCVSQGYLAGESAAAYSSGTESSLALMGMHK